MEAAPWKDSKEYDCISPGPAPLVRQTSVLDSPGSVVALERRGSLSSSFTGISRPKLTFQEEKVERKSPGPSSSPRGSFMARMGAKLTSRKSQPGGQLAMQACCMMLIMQACCCMHTGVMTDLVRDHHYDACSGSQQKHCRSARTRPSPSCCRRRRLVTIRAGRPAAAPPLVLRRSVPQPGMQHLRCWRQRWCCRAQRTVRAAGRRA